MESQETWFSCGSCIFGIFALFSPKRWNRLEVFPPVYLSVYSLYILLCFLLYKFLYLWFMVTCFYFLVMLQHEHRPYQIWTSFMLAAAPESRWSHYHTVFMFWLSISSLINFFHNIFYTQQLIVQTGLWRLKHLFVIFWFYYQHLEWKQNNTLYLTIASALSICLLKLFPDFHRSAFVFTTCCNYSPLMVSWAGGMHKQMVEGNQKDGS